MNKYVKTTKGIYELTPYRHLTDYPIIDNGRTIGNKQKLFANKSYIYYGDVVAQSDNLNDLIEKFGIKDTKTNEIVYIGDVHHSKDNVKELKNLLDDYNRVTEDTHTLIGFIVINDDIVKVTEMNKEGEWKLYER